MKASSAVGELSLKDRVASFATAPTFDCEDLDCFRGDVLCASGLKGHSRTTSNGGWTTFLKTPLGIFPVVRLAVDEATSYFFDCYSS
jgi:hypothetical protein